MRGGQFVTVGKPCPGCIDCAEQVEGKPAGEFLDDYEPSGLATQVIDRLEAREKEAAEKLERLKGRLASAVNDNPAALVAYTERRIYRDAILMVADTDLERHVYRIATPEVEEATPNPSKSVQGFGTTEVEEGEPARFKINRLGFRVPAGPITGAELRQMPMPPIGDDSDIYRESGAGLDAPIAATDSLSIKAGDSFYSVPKVITPGRSEVEEGVPGSGLDGARTEALRAEEWRDTAEHYKIMLDARGREIEQLERHGEKVQEAASGVLGSVISSGSGPVAPVFDAHDAQVERKRGRWSVIDQNALDSLRAALVATPEPSDTPNGGSK